MLRIHSLAFGHEKEANLVKDILNDSSSQHILSLMASEDSRPLGHLLFSKVQAAEPAYAGAVSLLAPLAVVPEAQGQGVCGKPIEEGLRQLTDKHVDLVFVLGHPGYCPKYGIKPAGRLGLAAPCPQDWVAVCAVISSPFSCDFPVKCGIERGNF